MLHYANVDHANQLTRRKTWKKAFIDCMTVEILKLPFYKLKLDLDFISIVTTVCRN